MLVYVCCTRQQLFEFMLEMPEIYGYEQDHLTHAERKALPQAKWITNKIFYIRYTIDIQMNRARRFLVAFIFSGTDMSLFDLTAIANELPSAWKSTILGKIDKTRIKILRMDAMAYGEEVHDYNEGLLVMSGRMMLEVSGRAIVVGAGQMYIAEAGVPHAVLPGSYGSLVIIDV